jgi:hypothetical protein
MRSVPVREVQGHTSCPSSDAAADAIALKQAPDRE